MFAYICVLLSVLPKADVSSESEDSPAHAVAVFVRKVPVCLNLCISKCVFGIFS